MKLLIIIIIIFFLLFMLKYKEKFINSDINPVNYNKMILSDAIHKINYNTKGYYFENPDSSVIYRPGTFNKPLLDKVSNLINPVINNINTYTNTNNVLHEIDNIVIETKGITKKYIIDFFTYDNKNYVKTRFIINIIETNDNVIVNNINLANSQYRSNIIQSDNKIHNIHKNTVISPDQYLKNDNVLGNNDTSLEHSEVTYEHVNNGIRSLHMNEWIQPIQAEILEQCNKSQFPSRKVYTEWTKQGIQYTDNGLGTDGINSSDYDRRIVASFNPTVTGLPRDNFGLKSIFDLSVGIPSFPTSGFGSGDRSQSGGKP